MIFQAYIPYIKSAHITLQFEWVGTYASKEDPNRVLKCDVIKMKFFEIMGFVRIF